jgi:tetratricopeptide (TPR) repeat protein
MSAIYPERFHMKFSLKDAVFISILILAQFSFAQKKSKKASTAKKAVTAVEKKGGNADTAAAKKAEETGPQTADDFQKLGDSQLKKKKVEAAMEAYKKCLELGGNDPAYSNVAFALGRHLHQKGEYKEAVEYLGKVQGKPSKTLSFKVMLAGALQKTGNNDSAIALMAPYGASTKITAKTRKKIYLILGAAYEEKKKIEDAAKWYNKYIRVGGKRTPDMVFLIASSYETTKPPTAIAIYKKNIKRFPKDFRNFLHIGKIYANSNTTRKAAIAFMKKAVTLADTAPATWLEIGRVYGRLSLKDNELAAYRTCLKNDDTNLEAKIRIGTILLEQGKAEDAIDYLMQAHRQAPDSIGPMMALASAYRRTGKSQDAMEMLKKLKKAQPKNIEVRKQLAFIYQGEEKDKKAIEEIEGALAIERDYELLVPYAQLLVKVGRADEAVPHLEEILGMMPDNIDALLTMATVFRAQKKYEEAINVYKEIGIYDPQNPRILYYMGETYLSQKKAKWADTFFKRSLKSDPSFALAEVGLAKVAKLYKKMDEFEQRLAKASSMAPDDPEVRKAIEIARNPSLAEKPKSSVKASDDDVSKEDVADSKDKEKKKRKKRKKRK